MYGGRKPKNPKKFRRNPKAQLLVVQQTRTLLRLLLIFRILNSQTTKKEYQMIHIVKANLPYPEKPPESEGLS